MPPSTTRVPCSPSPTHCSKPSAARAIETTGKLTRGMTVIDRRTLKDRPRPNCDVLTRIDGDRAWDVIVSAIGAAGT